MELNFSPHSAWRRLFESQRLPSPISLRLQFMSFLHEKNISDKYELGDHTIFFENIYVSKVKI